MIARCVHKGCTTDFEMIGRSRKCPKHRTLQKYTDRTLARRKERKALGLDDIGMFNHPAFEEYGKLLVIKKQWDSENEES